MKSQIVSSIQPNTKLGAWKRFLVEESHRFTQQGVDRVNDSICTYVYVVLGAQARTRTAIIRSSGRSFDAKREFVNFTKILIDSLFNLADSISRYQKVLLYTRAALHYSFCHSLYMAPCDMLINIGGKIVNYDK